MRRRLLTFAAAILLGFAAGARWQLGEDARAAASVLGASDDSRAGFVHNLEEANALLDVAEGRLEQ